MAHTNNQLWTEATFTKEWEGTVFNLSEISYQLILDDVWEVLFSKNYDTPRVAAETQYFCCMALSPDTMPFGLDTVAASLQTLPLSHIILASLALSSLPCDCTNTDLNKQGSGE